MLDGHEQYAQVQADGPSLNVVEIILDPLAERGSAAPSVDLGPPGHPPGDGVAEVVVGHGASELGDEAGPFGPRPHQAHLTSDDVNELRQFVNISVPDPVADSGASEIG